MAECPKSLRITLRLPLRSHQHARSRRDLSRDYGGGLWIVAHGQQVSVSHGCVATMSDVAAPIPYVLPTGPRPSTRRAQELDRSPCDRRSQRGRGEAL
jgi:hypothetical protein